MFSDVEFLGSEADLPAGWCLPTRGLVELVAQYVQEGLALPSSPHLYAPSMSLTHEALASEQVLEGIELLKSYCNPVSPSSLRAVGMAYPQLARANNGSFRAFAVNMGMPDARNENRQTDIRVFYNPIVTAVESEGWEERNEHCFSAPGIAVTVKRWKVIDVQGPDGRSRRYSGTEAWFIQHENDHLNGVLCQKVALDQGGKLYYAPPEKERMFFRREYDLSYDWPEFPAEQWFAMVRGEFRLEDYFKFLR
ncbi:MAG TPA: peptide deformylase [Candidatus Saccharimonadales bacterium]|nr:peptide deformylase [Candidatus Saccharimonadales bacterium]